MDFGEILDRWEREGGGGREKGVRHRRNAEPREGIEGGSPRGREDERRRLKELKPQDRIDLHGMKAAEAAEALEDFLVRSSRAGLEKVLVVHGKGNHSSGEPVLGKVARRVIEASPVAGRFGEADRANGGRGALWVLLRSRG